MSIGDSVAGHSHWDIHDYADHRVRFCYRIVGRDDSVAGREVFHLPHREQDSSNFMDLQAMADGFRLSRRVNGVSTVVPSDPSVPDPGLALGAVGQEIMVWYEMTGPDYYLYAVGPSPDGDPHDSTRGRLLYHWTDPTYPTGVNISYYTVRGYFGEWENVYADPLDGTGSPHEIHGLMQDARNHPAVTDSQSTFDDPTPASGSATSITGATANFGLASGANYRYDLTVTGTTGSFDFRDPVVNDTQFFAAGWYRLRPGNATTGPSIQRYNGATAGTKWTAPAPGGSGSYTLRLAGPDMYLDRDGVQVLHVSDGGPQSGVRVRVTSPGTAVWNWTGTAG